MCSVDQLLKSAAQCRDPKMRASTRPSTIYWYSYKFIDGEFYYLVCQDRNQADPNRETADTYGPAHTRANPVVEFVLRKIKRDGKTKRVRSLEFSSQNKKIVPAVSYSTIVDEDGVIYVYITFVTPQKIFRFDIAREYVLTRTTGWDEVEATTDIKDMLLDDYGAPHVIRPLDSTAEMYPINKKYFISGDYGYVISSSSKKKRPATCGNNCDTQFEEVAAEAATLCAANVSTQV